MGSDAPTAALSKRDRNKAEKLQRIQAAAAALFDERGFEATTTAAIAERAGVGAGTLYLYVGSKDDLLVSVFRERAGRAWADAFAANDPEASISSQLVAIFSAVAVTHAGELNLARAFFKALQFVEQPTRSGATELMRDIYSKLIAIIEAAQSRGELDPAVPARGLAENLFASWFMLMQRHTAGRSSLDQVLTRLANSFELALRGLLQAPSSD